MIIPMADKPWFLWDLDISEEEFQERLCHPDPDIRAQWQGRLMREANVSEVWTYLSLPEVLANWQRIARHLGRRRDFWQWLLDGWRSDGLIPAQ